MASDEATPLRQVIAQNLRATREDLGYSQDNVAAMMRAEELGWHRSTVASVEAGDREVSLAELIVLARVLDTDLLSIIRGLGPAAETRWLDLGGPEVRLDVLPSYLMPQRPSKQSSSGAGVSDQRERELRERSQSGWRSHGHAEARKMTEQLRADHRAMRSWWPAGEGPGDHIQVKRGSMEDAAVKASRRLGLTPFEVSALAFSLWGHSLTKEREDRLEADGHIPMTAAQAKRGHVTRQLLAEMRAEISTRRANE